MTTMKTKSGDRIATDEMNEIISAWVDAEIPVNPAGYETSDEGDGIRDARSNRFQQIVDMPDAEFRVFFEQKTGNELSEMNPDGSYTVRGE